MVEDVERTDELVWSWETIEEVEVLIKLKKTYEREWVK